MTVLLSMILLCLLIMIILMAPAQASCGCRFTRDGIYFILFSSFGDCYSGFVTVCPDGMRNSNGDGGGGKVWYPGSVESNTAKSQGYLPYGLEPLRYCSRYGVAKWGERNPCKDKNFDACFQGGKFQRDSTSPMTCKWTGEIPGLEGRSLYKAVTSGSCGDQNSKQYKYIDDEEVCAGAFDTLDNSRQEIFKFGSSESNNYPKGCTSSLSRGRRFNPFTTSTQQCSETDRCLCIHIFTICNSNSAHKNTEPCICKKIDDNSQVDFCHSSSPYCNHAIGKCGSGQCVNTNLTAINTLPCNCGPTLCTNGQTHCQKYSETAGTCLKCLACNSGRFAPVQTTPQCCIDCPSGYFYSTTTETNSGLECLSCTPGFFTDEEGAAACKSCVPGQFSNETIPVGHTSCQNCFKGTYTEVQTSSICSNCPAGYRQHELGKTGCHECAVGKNTKGKGKWSETECINCAYGQYGDESALVFCKKCSKGRDQGGDGTATGKETADSCIECDKGRFNPFDGSPDRCYPCATSQLRGAISCNGCDAGTKKTEQGDAMNILCELCEMGKYQNERNADTCINCQVGKYSDENGLATCKLCPRGRHGRQIKALNVSIGCSECISGRYSDVEGLKSCKKCKIGTFLEEKGKDTELACLNCQAGRYSSTEGANNITFCIPCPTGYMSPTVGATDFLDCTACQKGEYMNEDGKPYCLPCIPGKYQNEIGKPYCKKCLANTKSNLAGSTKCDNCGIGEKSEPESAKCVKCDAGEAGTGKNGACELCSEGQYRNSTMEAAICFHCPAGWFSEAGSTKCQLCEAGKFSHVKEKPCENCGVGRFRAGDMSGTECKGCMKGFYQELPGQASCLPCIPGEYQNENGQKSCKLCAANHYSTSKNRTIPCEPCKKGESSESGSTKCNRVPCKAGEFVKVSSGKCKQCPAGWISEELDAPSCDQCKLGTTTLRAGSAVCAQCDLGKYGSKRGECSPCATGTYQDGKGETSCKECEADTYLSETGKSSKADCLKCTPENERTTGIVTGATSDASCLCKKIFFYQTEGIAGSTKCIACPSGGNCTCRNGITMNEIIPLNGFWRPFARSNVFSNCEQAYRGIDAEAKAKERCNNILYVRNQTFRHWMMCRQKYKTTFKNEITIFDDPDVQCTNGYRGNLCASCADNFVHQGEDCIPCEGGADVAASVYILLSLCFVIFIIVLLIFQRVRGSELTNKANIYFGQLKIFIMFLQIVSAMPYSIDSVQWPKNFRLLAITLNFVNFEFMKLMDFSSCTLSLHPLNRFALHVSFVPLFIFAVIAAYITSICLYSCNKSSTGEGGTKKDRKVVVQHRQGMALKFLITMLLLLYPGLGTRIFSIFRCSTIDGFPENQQWFQEDLSLECHVPNTRHNLYLQIAAASVILIVLGTPFTITFLLFHNRKHLHNTNSPKHDDIQFRLGSLYVQYEKNFWYFEIVVIIVKQIMTGALGILEPGTPIQVGLAVLVMFVYLMVLLRFTPYKSNADDMLAYISTSATLFIAMIGLFLKLDENSEADRKHFDPHIMGNILVGITIAVIIFTFLNLIFIKGKIWYYIERIFFSPAENKNISTSNAKRDGNTKQKDDAHDKENDVIEKVAKDCQQQPLQRRMSGKGFSIDQIKKVVNVTKVEQIQKESKTHRVAHQKSLQRRETASKKSLQKRLETRKSKSKVAPIKASLGAESQKPEITLASSKAVVKEVSVSDSTILPTASPTASPTVSPTALPTASSATSSTESSANTSNPISTRNPSLEERRKNIQYFRALLEKKCQKKENFNKIFSKIDKDNSGTLNKKEFLRLTKSVLKGSDDGTAKKLLADEMFDTIWADFCNKYDEVDCITASNWIFSDKTHQRL